MGPGHLLPFASLTAALDPSARCSSQRWHDAETETEETISLNISRGKKGDLTVEAEALSLPAADWWFCLIEFDIDIVLAAEGLAAEFRCISTVNEGALKMEMLATAEGSWKFPILAVRWVFYQEEA